MHEINAAAETITTAADPDANIIFGATINPDLEGEVIITVVATGFDAAYYGKASESGAPAAAPVVERSELDVSSPKTAKQEEKALSEIDMSLDEDKSAEHEDFTSDKEIPNIWSLPDEDEDKDKKKDSDKKDDESKPSDDAVVSSDLEDELEKPSFLRRLSSRRKKDGSDDDSFGL
jgi:hypothetical protein